MKTATAQVIVVGIKGTVLALDPQSGSELWRRQLTGAEFVNVVVHGEKVLATTKGEIFCLEERTGAVLWHNPLTGLGRGLVSIATEPQTGTAALLREKLQRDEEAAATAASGAVIV